MCCCAKSKSAKFKICGYISVATGVVLLALGIAWPFIMQPLVIDAASQSTQLKKENQDMWRGIPGKFDIKIDRATHVYDCINRDDVRLYFALIYLPHFRSSTKARYHKYKKLDLLSIVNMTLGQSPRNGMCPTLYPGRQQRKGTQSR